MYLEIAQLEITQGDESAFEREAALATHVFAKAQGCMGMELRRSLENPSKYLLFVKWATLEDHIQHFKNDPEGLAAWRSHVSQFYSGPATLEHSTRVFVGFSRD